MKQEEEQEKEEEKQNREKKVEEKEREEEGGDGGAGTGRGGVGGAPWPAVLRAEGPGGTVGPMGGSAQIGCRCGCWGPSAYLGGGCGT